jgi:hypothetical protein
LDPGPRVTKNRDNTLSPESLNRSVRCLIGLFLALWVRHTMTENDTNPGRIEASELFVRASEISETSNFRARQLAQKCVPRDGESYNGAGYVRPVPPHVPPTPEGDR